LFIKQLIESIYQLYHLASFQSAAADVGWFVFRREVSLVRLDPW